MGEWGWQVDLQVGPSLLGKSAKSDLQVHLQVPISPNKHLRNLSESNLADFSEHTKSNLQNLNCLQILAKFTKPNKDLACFVNRYMYL